MMSTARPGFATVLVIVVTTLLLSSSSARAQCTGDCAADGRVTIDELITMVSIALGDLPALACPVGDADIDGAVSIDEIVAGVGNALDDCSAAIVRRSFDFRGGRQGWEAGFADYSPDMIEILELEAGIRDLPEELGLEGSGFFISGSNRSDDLFMFLRRRLGTADGIEPNRAYSVDYTIVFASAAQDGCIGVGGAPGESVFLKAGATAVEPQPFLDEEDNHIRMNVDKGEQAQGGPAASVVGNVANGLPCDPGAAPFVTLRRQHRHAVPVAADAEGNLWLLLGTDSGFEGTTSLFYQRIEVTLGEGIDATAAAAIDLN